MKKVCLIFLVLVSCASDSKHNAIRLGDIEKVVNQELSENYRAIFFVPSTGCTGCINAAEAFLSRYRKNEHQGEIFFVVSGHKSLKSAKLRLGDAVHLKNIYLDIYQNFNREPYLTAYPKVCFISDGEIDRIEEITPSTSEAMYKELQAF